MAYRYHGNDIDGPVVHLEQLYVRTRNLNDLVGTFTFQGAAYHLLTGNPATDAQEAILDRYLTAALSSLAEDNITLEVISSVIGSGATVSQAIIAGLMVDKTRAIERIGAEFNLEEIGLSQDHQSGLYYVGLIPALMSFAIDCINGLPDEYSTQLVDRARTFKLPLEQGKDFVELVFALCTGRGFRHETEKKLFNSVMVAFHAGFGFTPPVIMAPRIAAIAIRNDM